MTDAQSEATDAVAPLLSADEDQLYAELGIRARALTDDPAAAGSFDPDVTFDESQMGALDDVKAFGRRLFARWNREAHSLVCGSDPDDAADREKLANAFGLGEAAVAGYVATLLVGSLGLAPALAAVIAALVVKRFFKPARDEFCETWATSLG